MGVFGKLFGKGGERGDGEARCNECGMTGGAHTDWCPLVQSEEEEGIERSVSRQEGAPSDHTREPGS